MFKRYRLLIFLLGLLYLTTVVILKYQDLLLFSPVQIKTYGDIRFQKVFHWQPDLQIKMHHIQLANSEDIKVIHLGNSTVWGAYVAPEETLSSFLNQKLYEDQTQRVFNFGYPGAWADKQAFYFNEALKFNPDLLLLGVSPVDYLDLAYLFRKSPDYASAFSQVTYTDSLVDSWQNLRFLTSENKQWVLHNLIGNLLPLSKYGNVYQHYLWTDLYWRFLEVRRALGYSDIPRYEQPTGPYVPPDSPKVTFEKYPLISPSYQALEYMLSEAAARQIPVILYLEPHIYRQENFEPGLYEASVNQIKKIAQDYHQVVLEFTELDDPKYFVDWDHLNPRGNEELAEKLTPYVAHQLAD